MIGLTENTIIGISMLTMVSGLCCYLMIKLETALKL